MILVDTNVFVDAARNKFKDDIFAGQTSLYYSAITIVEALGYHKLKVDEMHALELLFSAAVSLPVSDDIVQQAIKLRQQRKMSLGDAIIAATALVNALEVWTSNTKDFRHINSLKLHNPLKP